jgi:release factor glutamine methyltransferase
VEEALRFAETLEKLPIRILDVCTGTGCIALSLACLLGENAEITAVDISADALSLAKENAEKLGIATERVNFLKSDLLECVTGEFDIIISNPPYILHSDMAKLSPTVRNYEPHLALNGGTDGLDIYRRLIPQCKNALRTGGALFLEIGPKSVINLLAEAGFSDINLLRDYAELERIVYGVIPNV